MRVFDSAFADVNEHFSTLVDSLFPGGTGRLSLTNPEDLLDTGVDVEVRPAGRNVRRLSLLSGGERSLVALAFLFAVFRSRPSPFYLMDEVEAALDDVNLQRFLGLVHEFRGEAQLIIVSHQKRTMEAADALYGVTMAPGGSSKVVSQKVPRDRIDPDLGVDVAAEPEGTESPESRRAAPRSDDVRPMVASVRESVAVEDAAARRRRRPEERSPGCGAVGHRTAESRPDGPGRGRAPRRASGAAIRTRWPSRVRPFEPAPHVDPVPVPDAGFSPEFVAAPAADETEQEHVEHRPSGYRSATYEPGVSEPGEPEPIWSDVAESEAAGSDAAESEAAESEAAESEAAGSEAAGRKRPVGSG